MLCNSPRHTRAISAAVFLESGAKMAPKVLITTSNEPSSNVRANCVPVLEVDAHTLGGRPELGPFPKAGVMSTPVT
jgi:hypothetical protein